MTARKQSLTLATGANGLDLSAASAGGFRFGNVRAYAPMSTGGFVRNYQGWGF